MGKYQYQRRDEKDHRARAEQQGGMYARTVREGIPEVRIQPGDYVMRICPPTWKNAKHYGMDVWMHSNIGGDNETFLSLKNMKQEADPIDEAIAAAKQAGDSETAEALKKYRRVGLFAIFKGQEDKGPQFWGMPWTVDRDIAALSYDKETREIIWIDDPDEGYWVYFTVKKEAGFNKYINVEVSRRKCPMSKDEDQQDEWMKFLQDNPVPSVLQYYSYDHIKTALAGKSKKRTKDEDGDKEPATRTRSSASSRKKDEDDDQPARRSGRSSRDDDDPPARRETSRRNDDADAPLDEEPTRRSRDDDDPPARRESKQDDEPQRRSRRDEEEDGPVRRESKKEEEPRRRSSRDDDDDPPSRRESKKDEDKDLRKSGGLRGGRRRRNDDDDD